MLREKCSSAPPLRIDNSVDVDVFTEYSGAPVEMLSLNATVGRSAPFDGKRVGKFSFTTTDISISDHGQYTAGTPQPPTINPRLLNIFIERGGGVIRRLSTSNAWRNFCKITTAIHQ